MAKALQMNAVDEMSALNRDFKAYIGQYGNIPKQWTDLERDTNGYMKFLRDNGFTAVYSKQLPSTIPLMYVECRNDRKNDDT